MILAEQIVGSLERTNERTNGRGGRKTIVFDPRLPFDFDEPRDMLIERPRVSRAWFMAEARINYSPWFDTARIIAVAIETFRRETIGRVGLGSRLASRSPLLISYYLNEAVAHRDICQWQITLESRTISGL